MHLLIFVVVAVFVVIPFFLLDKVKAELRQICTIMSSLLNVKCIKHGSMIAEHYREILKQFRIS